MNKIKKNLVGHNSEKGEKGEKQIFISFFKLLHAGLLNFILPLIVLVLFCLFVYLTQENEYSFHLLKTFGIFIFLLFLGSILYALIYLFVIKVQKNKLFLNKYND